MSLLLNVGQAGKLRLLSPTLSASQVRFAHCWFFSCAKSAISRR